MGILGLAKLIADISPGAIREQELKHYFGTYFIRMFQSSESLYDQNSSKITILHSHFLF